MMAREMGGTHREIYGRGPAGQPDFLCPVCDSRPCMDNCARQQLPDTLHMKASRAGLTPLQYATERADVLARYPDIPAARDAAALLAAGPLDNERRIFGPDAVKVALRVVAGEHSAPAVLAAGPGGGVTA